MGDPHNEICECGHTGGEHDDKVVSLGAIPGARSRESASASAFSGRGR